MIKNIFTQNIKAMFKDLAENAILHPDYSCVVCGKDIKLPNMVCADCKIYIDNLVYEKTQYGVYCIYKYSGVIRDIIHRLKYDDRADLSRFAAKAIADSILKRSINVDVVTYVPMNAKKKKKRGYDQSELIAKEVSKLIGVPFNKLIERIKETKPQYDLRREERIENLKDAFSICGDDVNLKTILLIDDICTTGTTMKECSKILKSKGAKVYCVALAGEEYQK